MSVLNLSAKWLRYFDAIAPAKVECPAQPFTVNNCRGVIAQGPEVFVVIANPRSQLYIPTEPGTYVLEVGRGVNSRLNEHFTQTLQDWGLPQSCLATDSVLSLLSDKPDVSPESFTISAGAWHQPYRIKLSGNQPFIECVYRFSYNGVAEEKVLLQNDACFGSLTFEGVEFPQQVRNPAFVGSVTEVKALQIEDLSGPVGEEMSGVWAIGPELLEEFREGIPGVGVG